MEVRRRDRDGACTKPHSRHFQLSTVWKSFRRSHELKATTLFYLFHADSQDRVKRFLLRGSIAGPFVARTRDTWTKNSYKEVWVCSRPLPLTLPQEISLPRAGNRIALTKSSKGGVKACSRAKRKSKETKSIWLDHVSASAALSRPFSHRPYSVVAVPTRFIPLAIPLVFVASARGRAGEKGNSIFHG